MVTGNRSRENTADLSKDLRILRIKDNLRQVYVDYDDTKEIFAAALTVRFNLESSDDLTHIVKDAMKLVDHVDSSAV